MTRNNVLTLVLIFILFGFCLWTVVPLLSSIDLVYQPSFSANATGTERSAIIENTVAVMNNRLAAVRNASVTRSGDQDIVVKLSQTSDENAAVNAIGSVTPYHLTDIVFHGERFGRRGLHLGLDLVGGVRLVYEAAVSENGSLPDAADMDRALLTIAKRIDKYGVVEPRIQLMSNNRIEVQLPGFTDIDTAKQLVAQTGFLEFREVETNNGVPVYLGDYLAQDSLRYIKADETGTRVFVAADPDIPGQFQTVAVLTRDADGSAYFTDATGNRIDKDSLARYTAFTSPSVAGVSWIVARGDDGTALTGGLLSDAAAGQDTSTIPNRYVVNITWNSEGARIFDQIAARLYGPESSNPPVQQRLGIVLDGNMLSAPAVNSATFGGRAEISGDFTPQSAQDLANLLKSGSLPIPLNPNPLFEQKVSATLGANFIHLSWQAGVIGIVLVMLFMISYYGMAGLLASLALVVYAAVNLTIFKLWPVTLSLAGLAGFIVSLGMAVDANVLIFERFKEELRKGRTMGAAVEEGFNRAWSAIIDSNVTTIIACIILIWLASSVITSAQVQGFAVTLLIGVLTSMFSAIIVTRTLLRFYIHTGMGKNQRLFLMDWGRK